MNSLEERVEYLIKRVEQLIILQGPMSNLDRANLKKSLVEEIEGVRPPSKTYEITIFRDIYLFMMKIVRKLNGIII